MQPPHWTRTSSPRYRTCLPPHPLPLSLPLPVFPFSLLLSPSVPAILAGVSPDTNPHPEDDQGQYIVVLVPTSVRAGRPARAVGAVPRPPRTPAPEKAEIGCGAGCLLRPAHPIGAAAGAHATVGGGSSLLARATARKLWAVRAGRDLIAWAAAGMGAGEKERPADDTRRVASSGESLGTAAGVSASPIAWVSAPVVMVADAAILAAAATAATAAGDIDGSAGEVEAMAAVTRAPLPGAAAPVAVTAGGVDAENEKMVADGAMSVSPVTPEDANPAEAARVARGGDPPGGGEQGAAAS